MTSRRQLELSVRALTTSATPAAIRWAERLGLPLVEAGAATSAAFTLDVGDGGLALRARAGPAVTIAPRRLAERRSGGRDLLLRAIGRLEPGAVVVDATGGLGADAFHLASHGVEVVVIERVGAIAALLDDALERAAAGREGAAAARAAARLELQCGDARDLLPRMRPAPAVVLLDPMYPQHGKRGLPKKGMALFRSLVGDDADAPELLRVALAVATRRVVVKRPLRAPPLAPTSGRATPSGRIVGTTTRFDLYAASGAAP